VRDANFFFSVLLFLLIVAFLLTKRSLKK